MDRLESLERQVGALERRVKALEPRHPIHKWVNYYPAEHERNTHLFYEDALNERDPDVDCICYHLVDGKLEGAQVFQAEEK